MRIAICDDMKYDNDTLRYHIDMYIKDKKIHDYKISSYPSGQVLIEKYRPNMYDLIFLDIDMPELTGLETAEHLLKLDRDISIVFATNMVGEVYNIFKYKPKDFLCKPISKDRVFELMDRLINDAKHQSQDNLYSITLKAGGKTSINLTNIMYFESDNKFVLAVKANESEGIRFVSSMEKVTSDLSEKGFVRISRSLIVNRLYVFSVFNDFVVLKGGVNFSIGKTYKKSVNENLKGILH